MVDRNYPNIILLCYPIGAGGNFLINCLSLNDQTVLRDWALAEQQLTQGLTADQKLGYLSNKLGQSIRNRKWSDFDLGCSNLFGVDIYDWFNEYPEILQRRFHPVVSKLMYHNKMLFLISHTTQHLDALVQFWKKPKVILFTDYHEFVKRRRVEDASLQQLKNYWSTIRDDSWPSTPPTTLQEFNHLPKTIQTELQEFFNGEIFRWIQVKPTKSDLHDLTIRERQKQLNYFEWNVAENFNGDFARFRKNLQNCASWAGLDIVVTDQELEQFYRNWLRAIDQVFVH